MAVNILLTAADKPEAVLTLLRSQPDLASQQDESGYSLLHAATSYGHLELLRALVLEFHVDVNLVDEDHETCLFVAETEVMARCLVEELHIDTSVANNQGQTALEKLQEEADFPDIVSYLQSRLPGFKANSTSTSIDSEQFPVTFTSVEAPDVAEASVVDEGLKLRIDELVARGDLQTEQGQEEFRQLVADVVKSHVTESSTKDRPRKHQS